MTDVKDNTDILDITSRIGTQVLEVDTDLLCSVRDRCSLLVPCQSRVLGSSHGFGCGLFSPYAGCQEQCHKSLHALTGRLAGRLASSRAPAQSDVVSGIGIGRQLSLPLAPGCSPKPCPAWSHWGDLCGSSTLVLRLVKKGRVKNPTNHSDVLGYRYVLALQVPPLSLPKGS